MAGEYWRCKRCGMVWSSDNMPRGMHFPCADKGDLEPVVVLPVADYERLRGIEKRLRDDKLAEGSAKDQFPGKMAPDYAVDRYRERVMGED